MVEPLGSVGFAFMLTLFAGLSTGIGGAIAFFAKRTNTRFLAVSLGFSAGVMVYVSLFEILHESLDVLEEITSETTAHWLMLAGFFSGIFITMLIDRLVPGYENPHEMRKVEEITGEKELRFVNDPKLMRVGLFTALAIAIHNFPEGLATFMAALRDPALGISIAIAIAIHNIPEGIAVSVPVYYATGSRVKAFWYSLLSGLAEPLGAITGYLALMHIMNDLVFGLVFAAVAGIMVYISFDELMPSAEEYGEHHLTIYGLIAGLAVMGISLVFL